MRTVVLLMFLVLSCFAQRPQPCRSPPLLTGALSVLSQSNGSLSAYAKYSYDAFGQRIRFKEIGAQGNKTFGIDALLLYREGVIYTINNHDRTCTKEKLTEDFHPMEVPKDATLLGQVILGSSSGPGEGLLVNTWAGEMQGGKYMSTFTEFGCFPVSSLGYTEATGWMLTSFFNILVGIEDPQELIPPPFCQNAELSNKGTPAGFYRLFLNQ